MGQSESTETPQTPLQTIKESIPVSSNPSYISSDILRRNFTNLEAYSLNNTFESLSSIKDSKEIIEEEAFIQYLGLPDEIGINPILYRSFTYLASYPSPAHKDIPLTYDGLIKAIAIYCDKINDVILEDRIKLIFESFAIHEEHSALGITPKAGVSYVPEVAEKQLNDNENDVNDVNDVNEVESEVSNTQEDKTGPLKIESINFNDDASFLKALGLEQENDEKPHIVSKVSCADMIKILTGIVWLTTNEIIPNLDSDKVLSKEEEIESSTDVDQIRKSITSIVEQMARYDPDNRDLARSQILSSETYIKWSGFRDFIKRNIPNIFNIFKPFFYGQFLIGQTLSINRQQSLMIGPHMQLLPKLDEDSDFLNPINMTLLSWTLPEEVLKRKEWNFLYSANKHGFSTNRFVSHVFKYTGPTLMLIQVQSTTNNTSYKQALPDASKKETILIGAYITDQWRSTNTTRTCFGSKGCYLFELYPTFELFPSSRRGKNYVYYNPASGIGFGGIATSGPTSSKIESMDKNSFVIQLDNTLQYGKYRNDALRDMDPTYDLSVTRPFFDISFEVLDIEVVGMGVEGVREKQKKEWKWEESESVKRQNGKKEVDKAILKMAGIIDETSRSYIEEKEP